MLPLHHAARSGHFEVVEIFLEVGGYMQLNEVALGLTALDFALDNNRFPIFDYILEKTNRVPQRSLQQLLKYKAEDAAGGLTLAAPYRACLNAIYNKFGNPPT